MRSTSFGRRTLVAAAVVGGAACVGSGIAGFVVGKTASRAKQKTLPPALDGCVTILQDDLKQGPKDATVVVVEFVDYLSIFCALVRGFGSRLAESNEDVLYVVKHLPMRFNGEPAWRAAQAVCAAQRMGRGWEMHNWLLENQRETTREESAAAAEEIGLSVDEFDRLRQSSEVRNAVERDVKEGRRLEVTGVPTFYVNGRHRSGAVGFRDLRQLVDEARSSANRTLAQKGLPKASVATHECKRHAK